MKSLSLECAPHRAAALPVVRQETSTQSGVSSTITYLWGLDLISTTSGAGATSFYLPDGLGSTAQLTDAAGVVTDNYAYDAFGALRSSSGNTANTFKFTGQQNDSAANRGLYYLRARYYDPALGRFLTQDPVPFTQRYAYVHDNPTNRVDPTGLADAEGGTQMGLCIPSSGWTPWSSYEISISAMISCTRRQVYIRIWVDIYYSSGVGISYIGSDSTACWFKNTCALNGPIFGASKGAYYYRVSFACTCIPPFRSRNIGPIPVPNFGQ